MDTGKTARSALWSLVENVGLSLISMGTLIIYTHLLSTAEFGLFSIVLALIELLQVVVTMLFHDALVQRAEATDKHFDTAFTFSVGLGLGLLLLCCLFAPFFAVMVKNPGAALVLCSMALCLPAASFSATIVARQRRELSFRPLAIRSLVGRFSGALGGVALVALGAGVWGLVAQQVLIQLVGSLILWKTCDERPRLRFARKEFKELTSFGVYAVGALFLNFGVKRLFTVLTGLLELELPRGRRVLGHRLDGRHPGGAADARGFTRRFTALEAHVSGFDRLRLRCLVSVVRGRGGYGAGGRERVVRRQVVAGRALHHRARSVGRRSGAAPDGRPPTDRAGAAS